ncbi:MAG: VPLPA-CTERM sorting domain-containing protein [Steroidobacteraceae bacterium]
MTLKTAVVGVLALGATSAFALTAPSTNNSDLILVVENTTTSATYALDTGISINSVMPASQLLPGGGNAAPVQNNTSIAGINSTIAASTTLQGFLASNPTSGDIWTVEAGQFNGTATTPTDPNPGQGIAIFTSTSLTSNTANTTSKSQANLNSYLNGLNQDVIQNTGGLYALNTATETTAAAYSSAAQKKYNFLTLADGGTAGTASDLFGFTGNSSGHLQSYILGTVNFSSAGTLTFTGNTETAPVPLPAAVWLFGSGLMGLVGVSRRRKAVV